MVIVIFILPNLMRNYSTKKNSYLFELVFKYLKLMLYMPSKHNSVNIGSEKTTRKLITIQLARNKFTQF